MTMMDESASLPSGLATDISKTTIRNEIKKHDNIVTGSKNDPFRWYRIGNQCMIIGAWVSEGLYAGMTGPTLTSLRDSIEVGTDEIAVVAMGRSLGILTGAFLGGFLFRIFYKYSDLLIFLSIAGMATIAIAPWGNSVGFMFFFFWTAGTSEGILNVGGVTHVMHLWKENAPTPLLLTTFGFGIGSLLAPQIVRPFLSSETQVTDSINGTTEMPFQQTFSVDDDNIGSYSVKDEKEMAFAYAYTIVAILILAVAGGYMYFVIKGPPKGFETWKPQGSIRDMLNPGSCANEHRGYSLALLILMFIFHGHFGGAQNSYTNFLYAFAMESGLNITSDEATAINSAYFAFYTLGKLLGGVAARFIRIQIIFGGSVGLSLLSIAALAIFGENNKLMFWIFNCAYALFSSLLVPSLMGWSNLYLHMNSMSTMVIYMGYGLLSMPFQYLAGYVFEKNKKGVLYVSTFCMAICLIVNVILQLVASCRSARVFPVDEKRVSNVDHGESSGDNGICITNTNL